MISTSHLLYWVLFPPLIGAFFNGVFSRHLSRRVVHWVGVGMPFISLLAVLTAVLRLTGMGHDASVTATLFPWITVGTLHIDFSLFLDPLSSVMTLVITFVGSFIHLYSMGYMEEDPGYARYFSHLNLFLFSMLLLVLGRSLPLLFIGWEGVGLCSYLLIGFWFDDTTKAKAGKKAFIVNRIGDFGFLLAMFLLAFVMKGDLSFPGIKAAVLAPGSYFHAHLGFVTLVTLLLFVGATGKSAQIPLYIWLPDAMAGPTPVSALIHAATMVTAGVYMIARLNFLYILSPTTMAVVAGIGALTALYAATIGIAQNDIKKVLAYSTISQLGYMFLAVGVGAFGAGVFHLMTHAFFKATLFLGAGAVIHAMHGEQNIWEMGGLRKHMPITNFAFLSATLAISGVPLFSGFFSKDDILYQAFTHRIVVNGHQVLPAWLFQLYWALGLIAAIITAFYMFRLYFVAFTGSLRSKTAHPHEVNWSMATTLIVLGTGSIVMGYVGMPIEKLNVFEHFLDPVFEASAPFIHSTGNPTTMWSLMGASVTAAGIGILLAWLMYAGAWRNFPQAFTTKCKHLYSLVFHKYYVDEIYGALVVRPLMWTRDVLHQVVDKGIIDNIFVNGSARFVDLVGRGIRIVANGDVQAYVAAFLLGALALILIIF